MFDLYELCRLVVFSVIEIRGSENAIKAIETLHKTEINGRGIIVREVSTPFHRIHVEYKFTVFC